MIRGTSSINRPTYRKKMFKTPLKEGPRVTKNSPDTIVKAKEGDVESSGDKASNIVSASKEAEQSIEPEPSKTAGPAIRTMSMFRGMYGDVQDEFDDMASSSSNIFKFSGPGIKKDSPWTSATQSNVNNDSDENDDEDGEDEDEDDVKKNKKKGKSKTKVTSSRQKWSRSFSVLTALTQVDKVMKEEELPLSKISFLKEVFDRLVAEGKVPDLTIEPGEPGRKKLRDRADKLKQAILKIVAFFEKELELPEGLVNKEEVSEVTAVVVRIAEMNQTFAGRVRSVKTQYRDAPPGRYVYLSQHLKIFCGPRVTFFSNNETRGLKFYITAQTHSQRQLDLAIQNIF